MVNVNYCKVSRGKNGENVKVLYNDYLILNLKTVEELCNYIISKNRKTNNKFDDWIEKYGIARNYSKMHKIYYLSGRIAPPRSFAKEPSRLLTSKDDFLVVIKNIISISGEQAMIGKIKKDFAKSAWGWFNCKKDLSEFFSGKKKPKNILTYDSEEEEIKEDDSDGSIDSDDDDDDNNEDNEDDEKEVFFDTDRDSGFHKSSSSVSGAKSSNQRNTPIKVPPPPSPPTTFKGKEPALKTPNSQKKRKWDDEDSDYEVIENLSTPVTTKIVTRKSINDEKEPMSIPSIPSIPPQIMKTSLTTSTPTPTPTTTTSTTTPTTTTPTTTPTTTTPTITAGNLDLDIDDSLGYSKTILQFQRSILSFFKTTTKRLDKLEERGGKRRSSHRKHQNKKNQQSSDEDALSDDNIESSQPKNEKNLEPVCSHSDDHHIPLDQLEKISLLPSETISFNSSKRLAEAFIYSENPLKSFIPISRKDDNGYVFVIASINKSYYIGVVNLNSSESFSEETIKELNERRLAFDYKPSFDIDIL
ncbi:hypothetical protein ACTFIY_011709 [Dictyostelium cf. discoideum]